MTEPQPLVCVFLKLPPSSQPVSRIREIVWNEFLPQLSRLNRAFEAAHATQPSSEARRIWSEARKTAAEHMIYLQDVSLTNNRTAEDFLDFLYALQKDRDVHEPYEDFQAGARGAVRNAGDAQNAMIQFREDLRIAVGRITAIMSGDNKDISSFVTESSQTILEIATSVEECGAMLEDYRKEFTEVQRQAFDAKDNPPSDEEFKVVLEKWQAFSEIADRLRRGWEDLQDEMRGYTLGDEPAMTPPDNPTSQTKPSDSSTPPNDSTSPIRPPDPSNTPIVPFWRRFFRRISSCLTLESIS